jgi:phytoene dehydrogenase-like protein
MSPSAFDAIVIGGGGNGLVASARLSKGGVRTLLIESEEALGGQSRPVEFAPGFFAAPFGIDPGWLPNSIAGALGIDRIEAVKSDAGISVAIEPGSFLNLSRHTSRAAQTIAHHSKADAAKWPAFTKQLRALAGFLGVLYRKPAPDVNASSSELLSMLDVGLAYRGLGRRNMIEFLRTLPLSVWELADDWFEYAPLKPAIAATGIRDHQQGPRSGGTGFVLLHHLVGAPAGSVQGRVPSRAGPSAFTQAAERSARSAGVTIRTGTPVAHIQVKNHAVTGVLLANGEEIQAPAILSTANPAATLLDAVDPVWLDPEFLHAVQNIRHRGCTAFVLYALDALPEFRGLESNDALHGTISLTSEIAALEKAADAAKYGTVSDHPHVEISIPSLFWPDQAPEGRHVLIARVQYAPYRLRDKDTWTAERRDALAERVTATIETFAPGFRSRIQHREAWSPLDLEERFGLREGAPSQGELGLDQILFMRPVAGWGRHGTPIEGLYLGGAGTHPGPGLLGLPGWHAAQRMLADRRRK